MLEQNARQILNVVTATFPSFEDAGPSQECEKSKSDIDELACRWRIIKGMPRGGENADEWTKAMTKVYLTQSSKLT